MDIEELKARSAGRKITKPEVTGWHCQHCNKNFAHESTFMNHMCKEQIRLNELQSPTGQAAYSYYSEWMRLYKRSVPPMETFATSRFYRSFINFAEHVIKISMPNPLNFIRLMSEKDKDISPQLWCRDQCYSMYLEWLDKNTDPFDLVQISIETLIDLAQKENVDIKNIFTTLGEKKITELIRLRKLSPWFLFCSFRFNDFLKGISIDDQREMIAVINPSFWTEKLNSNNEIVDLITEMNKELGI